MANASTSTLASRQAAAFARAAGTSYCTLMELAEVCHEALAHGDLAAEAELADIYAAIEAGEAAEAAAV